MQHTLLRALGLALAAAALLAARPSLAQPAGDAALGSDVFSTHCAECHSVKDGRNKKGPSLFGVAGRQAAAVPGFSYSDAMKASGWSWTPQRLDAYITLPKQALPGGKMKYDGLADAKARADLLAYLATLK
ncbi:c-type cytochrome [Azohydromonas lata]|uniref:C-type cytochrome n=1 Tax=Azohydromonas lata TaxID=45677 RepID=A0ABU5IP44_9BURK|nr:c-type cytochrome [Azohydromonas lata]MDZ5460660.1 c-type cytochrome [Azohydromonas lata]